MTAIITGGRDFVPEGWEATWLQLRFIEFNVSQVFHGGARGADTFGGQVADLVNLPVKVFPAEWWKHGKSAGPIRNAEMLREAQKHDGVVVLAFAGGKGTAHMKALARRHNVEVREYYEPHHPSRKEESLEETENE